jgi:hypothetical protein
MVTISSIKEIRGTTRKWTAKDSLDFGSTFLLPSSTLLKGSFELVISGVGKLVGRKKVFEDLHFEDIRNLRLPRFKHIIRQLFSGVSHQFVKITVTTSLFFVTTPNLY